MKFYPLRVAELCRETADTVSVRFDVPEEFSEKFKFRQGQYLTLRTSIDGEDLRRSYSICAAPHEGSLRVAIKKVPGGVFSTFANERLQVGEVLQVMPPQGKFFTNLSAENSKTYVAFAVGSGITPIFSILKSVLHEESHSRFVLFFGNRGFDHIVFREELEALKNLYPERLAVHHVFSRESLGADLFFGRLDGEKCRRFSRYFFDSAEVDEFFLCGPEEMIFSVRDELLSLGVEPQRVHFELFTAGTPAKKSGQAQANFVAENKFDASVKVIQDSAEFEFYLQSDGSNLLDAAMRAGADLPFSCKGGVCSTCKAKVLEGTAAMELCYGLEPDEVAAGYILTCQSHPTSRRLVVSFDV